jgi:hypothetical protein
MSRSLTPETSSANRKKKKKKKKRRRIKMSPKP